MTSCQSANSKSTAFPFHHSASAFGVIWMSVAHSYLTTFLALSLELHGLVYTKLGGFLILSQLRTSSSATRKLHLEEVPYDGREQHVIIN